ncbi:MULTISPECIES: glutathione S-transferase family protein [unclassified Roseovarius]|uniref:glutathione S-transferase family protein n=1 Tax=unclassified Roseovarius TaxID=2614913 RepID=UPI00273EE21A|nr:glutathione S-transferase family protein [Roseovarius sp. MMSF_3350]
MTEGLRLTGYRFSVYTRSVRMVLAAKGLGYDYAECDPFGEGSGALSRLHPFGRVPVLEAGAFRLWETQAILDYIEGIAPEPRLVPKAPEARARMRQVMGIADSYAYGPLVRQAFSNGVFAALEGESGDDAALAEGLAEAPRVLDALEEIAAEDLVLRPGALDLASCHLWPMLDYFGMVPGGAEMIAARPALAAWCGWMETCDVAQETRPNLTREAMA